MGRAYVLAGCFFVLGSVLFFPELEEYYLGGCYFYFFGGGIYLCTSAYDLLEVWHTTDGEFDRAMNLLYVVGSVIYLVGTWLYLPGVPHLGGRMPTELGAWCFIVGSLFFVYACFVNGAHTGDVFAEASSRCRCSACAPSRLYLVCKAVDAAWDASVLTSSPPPGWRARTTRRRRRCDR